MHPSFGLGGAERLIADAALVLAQRGHQVTLFTCRYDAESSFDELRSGLFEVREHGRLLPSSIAGRLKAPANIVRTSYLALRAAVAQHYDIVVVDLVAHVVPVLRLLRRARTVYYCHFPDVLLTPAESRRSPLYRLYRFPLDRVERAALGAAHLILVNSAFTADVLSKTFPRLPRPSRVLRPGVDVDRYRPAPAYAGRDDQIILLSIARYAPTKNLSLAVDALAALRARVPPERFLRVRLILAGGLSDDTPGARTTYEALVAQIEEHGLARQVELHASVDDDAKLALLQRARALVYTPVREHFGIVPLEAMACGVPVVAVASGGPRETVVHGRTGYLAAATPQAFAHYLATLTCDDELARDMAREARAHAERTLSRAAFAQQLEDALQDCLAGS